ncbi:hypothetical protein N9Y72_03310 [Gammaproteobacteria bacterium]|jgi:hypothetical protein|nr:hypothetical protein [Gammaproteobacteria bacterium]
MVKKFSRKQIQAIAFRISRTCKGCPEKISYHDIKDELAYKSNLRQYLTNEKNREVLFDNIQLDKELISILEDLTTDIDEFDRRRVALFHGMVQFPMTLKKTPFDEIKSYLDHFNMENVQHELPYIFITSLLDVISKDGDIESRKKLKLISDITEGDDEESLFKHFMRLHSSADHLATVSTTMNLGSKKPINKLTAMKILFDFDDYDFQDLEFKGGSSPLGKTKPLDLRKKIIQSQIDNLRGLSIPETIEELS